MGYARCSRSRPSPIRGRRASTANDGVWACENRTARAPDARRSCPDITVASFPLSPYAPPYIGAYGPRRPPAHP